MSRHDLHTQNAVATPEKETAQRPSAVAMPTHDQIAHRAYDIYVKTGYKQANVAKTGSRQKNLCLANA